MYFISGHILGSVEGVEVDLRQKTRSISLRLATFLPSRLRFLEYSEVTYQLLTSCSS